VRKYYSLAAPLVALGGAPLRYASHTFGMSDNGVMKYLISDHLGSTVAITDSTGNVLAETRYMPFGEPRADAGSLAGTDKTYTSQRDVPDTGWMDYRARNYSPWLGRFIQPDTIVPYANNSQMWNRYTYVGNNSINHIDPSGHRCLPEDMCDAPSGDWRPISDSTPLSKNGMKGSGSQMKEVYERLFTYCRVYGSKGNSWCPTSRKLSLRDFVKIMMSAELSGFGSVLDKNEVPLSEYLSTQEELSETAANWFSESCFSRKGCTGISYNSIFNWLGENFQSAQAFFNKTVMPLSYPNMEGLSSAVTNAVFSVGFTQRVVGYYDPVHWANGSYFENEYGEYPKIIYKRLNGKTRNDMDNAFFVISYAEEHRLGHK